jgi:hypothetical protein
VAQSFGAIDPDKAQAAAAAAEAAIGVMQRLNAAITANKAAQDLAAAAGTTLAQVNKAIAAEAKMAADAIKAQADAQRQAASEAKAAASAQVSAQRQAAAAQKQAAQEAKQAAAEQQAAMLRLRDATDAARGPTREFGDSAARMGFGMAAAHGPIGKVQNLMQQLGPQGQAAAAALGVLTIAITTVTNAITGGMSIAIGIVEKMTQRLAIFSALGGSAAAGKATLDMVGRLSEKLPFATSQLSDWAQAMQRAGLQGKGLESAVKAIAAAAAINPAGGAEAAEKTLSKLAAGEAEALKFVQTIQKGGPKAQVLLREMGINLADIGTAAQRAKMSAADMSKAIEKALVAKGKGPLDAMGNTFDVIVMKAKAGLMGLFGGLGKSVDPFMAQVKSLFAMFNRGGVMIGVLKPIITSVFSTLFSWATRAVSFIHSAFQQIVIAGLKVRIGIQPIVVAMRLLWVEVQKAVAATGLFSGKSSALAAVLSLLKTVIVGTFTGAVMFVAGFVRVLAGFIAISTAIVTKVSALFKSFRLPSLAAAAANMIASFVSGIGAKISSVIGAMKGIGQAAKSALFGALGIASPSKVALEAAGNVTGTFARKVDDGKGETRRAFADMVKVPPPGKGEGSGSAGSGTASLVGVLDRLCDVIEASPGVREILQQAFAEASLEGSS